MSESANASPFQSNRSVGETANDLEHNPAVVVPILANDEYRRRSMSNVSLRIDPIEETFDWEQKEFHEKTLWPIWITYLIHLALGVALVAIPLLLDQLRFIPAQHSFFQSMNTVASKGYDDNPSWVLKLIKGCILIGSTYSTYILVKLNIYLVPHCVVLADRLSRKDILMELKPKIEHFLALRKYLAIAIAFAIQSIVATLIYPLKPVVSETLSSVSGKLDEDALNVLWSRAIEKLSSHTMDFYIIRASYSLAAIFLLVLVEKILIQALMVKFHSHAYSSRISDNNFAIKVIKKLLKTASANVDLHMAGQKANYIFEKVSGGVNFQIGRADFAPFLSVADSTRFWGIIDPEDIGDFSQDAFKKAIKQVYYERNSLDRGTLDHAQIIDKLDWLLMLIFSFIILLATMILLELPTRLVFNTIVPILTALGFIFNSSLIATFESLIFVIFTHPFDVGDSIIIEDLPYVVKELGFWASTFLGPGHRLTVISNLKLRSLPISNLRRSPHQIEVVQVQILPTVPRSKIEELERKLNDWVKENKHDYQPKICINKFRIQDKNHMLLEIPLIHRGNFHNVELKERRTRNFMYRLREAMEECDIEVAPPYW